MKNLKSKAFLFVMALLLAASLSQFTASTAKAADANQTVSGNELEPFCDRPAEHEEN